MPLNPLDSLILDNQVAVYLEEALRVELGGQAFQAFLHHKVAPRKGGGLHQPVLGLEQADLPRRDGLQHLRPRQQKAVAVLGLEPLHQVQCILQLPQAGLLRIVAAHSLPLGHTLLQLLRVHWFQQIRHAVCAEGLQQVLA